MSWRVIDANQLVPAELVTAISSITNLADVALDAVKESFKTTTRPPAIPSIPDPTAAATTALLDALDALIAGTQIHAITIPAAKTLPNPPSIRAPATVDDLQAWLDVKLGLKGDTADAYQTLIAGNSGNAGFYKAFLESMFDANDPNRPQFFRQSDAVTMAVIVMGAASYAPVAHAASMLDQLLRPSGTSGDAGNRVIPVPQNVVARATSTSTGPRIAVRVTWDSPSTVIVPPYFPGLAVSVRRYAVIRMTGRRAASVRGVLDLFPTQDLVEGMSARDAVVVGIGSGANTSFLDVNPPVDPTIALYYCVALETSVREPSGDTIIPFDRVSGVSKVSTTTSPSQTGSPPDWTTTGSAIDLFPDLALAARRTLARARALADGRPNPTARLTKALEVAISMTDRMSARANDLMADVNHLSASLRRALPSMHVIQITNGTGGNAFLAAELARRLGDLSDAARPPFDHGEYTCGVCFVAGAPRLADLATTIAFFDSLLGPAEPTNPLLSVLTAIDTVVTQAETAVFGPNMRPLPAGTNAAEIDPLTGEPPIPSTPVISAEGVAVASDDPRNTDQGNTNVIPLTELC